MAKRRSNRAPSTSAQLGASLTSLAARVQALNDARAQVAGEIRQIIAAAETMLAELGGTATKGRAGHPRATVGSKPGRRREVSALARKRMADAARRRWARHRREKAQQG